MSICTVCGLAACGLASHQQIAKSDSIDQAMQRGIVKSCG